MGQAMTRHSNFAGTLMCSKQASVVVTTAAFMMPIELLLPALLRLANTPPVSSSVVRGRYQVVHKQPPNEGKSISMHEELLLQQKADFQKVLKQGGQKIWKFMQKRSSASPQMQRHIEDVQNRLLPGKRDRHTILLEEPGRIP